jgi:hypothetical protein
MMTIDQALDIVVARTGHERFRSLCDPAHESYDPAYPPYIVARAEEIEREDGEPPSPQSQPPGWLQMGANFVTAAV